MRILGGKFHPLYNSSEINNAYIELIATIVFQFGKHDSG